MGCCGSSNASDETISRRTRVNTQSRAPGNVSKPSNDSENVVIENKNKPNDENHEQQIVQNIKNNISDEQNRIEQPAQYSRKSVFDQMNLSFKQLQESTEKIENEMSDFISTYYEAKQNNDDGQTTKFNQIGEKVQILIQNFKNDMNEYVKKLDESILTKEKKEITKLST